VYNNPIIIYPDSPNVQA